MFNRKKIKKLENDIHALNVRVSALKMLAGLNFDCIEKLEESAKIQIKINKTHNDILKSLNKKFPKYL